MALSQPKLPSWSISESSEFGIRSSEFFLSSELEIRNSELGKNNNNYQLPCLDSSNQCVQLLTDRAIASSSKLKQTASRIALIEERLALTEERIEYTSKKKWTNYISTNPVDIIQNIFGGGGVQRDNLAIRQCQASPDRILRLLLDIEAAERRQELLTSQLETLERQREVTRIAYRFGRGSTSQVLGMEDRRARLTEQIIDIGIKKDGAVRELEALVR